MSLKFEYLGEFGFISDNTLQVGKKSVGPGWVLMMKKTGEPKSPASVPLTEVFQGLNRKVRSERYLEYRVYYSLATYLTCPC
jgi:hypothetical protein